MKPNQAAMRPSLSWAVSWAVLTAVLLLLNPGCQTGVGVEGSTVGALIDSPSNVPRLAGIWDIYAVDGAPRDLFRLTCDETGDPRQLQGFSDSLPGVLAEIAASDCNGVVNGFPSRVSCQFLDGVLHGANDGRTYAASGRAWQEVGRLLIEILVETQDGNGNLHTATLNLDLSFAGEPVVLDDEMNRLLDEFDFSPSGMVMDAARGTLVVSVPANDASRSDPISVVALRSVFY